MASDDPQTGVLQNFFNYPFMVIHIWHAIYTNTQQKLSQQKNAYGTENSKYCGIQSASFFLMQNNAYTLYIADKLLLICFKITYQQQFVIKIGGKSFPRLK